MPKKQKINLDKVLASFGTLGGDAVEVLLDNLLPAPR
jgi:hypothetical protein